MDAEKYAEAMMNAEKIRIAPLLTILDRLRSESVGKLQGEVGTLLGEREDLRKEVPTLWAKQEKLGY